MKYSRDFFSKVHFVAIVDLSLGSAGSTQFKYDRYPNGGPERIQCPSGEFARKDGKTWLKSNDWGDTGTPADAAISGRLNNWVGLVDGRLNAEPALKFAGKRDEDGRDEFVFEEAKPAAGAPARFVFSKYQTDTDNHPPLLSEFSGPMKLANHAATVKMSFSYLIAVKIDDVTEIKPSPAPGASAAQSPPSQSSNNAKAVTELINRGIEKGKRKDLKGAIADFTKAIQLDPKEARGYANRAYAKRLKKDAAGALADYNKAIELDPQNAEDFYARGNVKAENHDLNGAIADYDRALELKPDHAHAYYNRAVAKKEKGDSAGSQADFKRAGEIEPELAPAAPPTINTISLLDGKFKIDIPSDFVREPDNPKEPKTLAKFAHNGEGGAWGTVLRGTHGLTPEELEGYLKKRVDEYTKGFKWMPKDSHLVWLKKEIVTIDGRKWADWSFVPALKNKKDWRNNPVYTRNLTTSYKGQLLEINFTTNLTTDPALKDEIDHIIASVHLEE